MTDAVNEKELQKERKEIIARILEIQKKFMELEREKGVTEKDIHHNPKGIVKDYK
jgi:predicted phage-related endonuclease